MIKTVYLPVTLKSQGDITDEQAINIGNSIAAMLQDGFFSVDNVYDAAEETDVELDTFKVSDETVTGSSFVPRAE